MLHRDSVSLLLGVALGCASCTCTSSADSGRRSPFRGDGVTGNGQAAEQVLELASFHSVEAGSALEVVIHPGQAQRVVLSGDSNLLKYVQARVQGGQLELSMDGPSMSPKLPLKAEIWIPELKAVEMSGAAELLLENAELASLVLDLSGASEALLSGRIGRLTAQLSGASELKGRACQVKQAELDLSGASEGELEVLEQLDADCSGASELELWGDPPRRKVECSGASEVRERGPLAD
ncbi:MAG: DUF2807 domain-containing protein [Candidatus Delongbacteria bacterium]